LLGRAAFATGLHERVLGDRAVVALFHRVDDRLRGDPLSCSRAEFAAFCDFFRTHFNVITLTDLLGRLERKQDVRGCLVITFDDGYKDNIEAAAPELSKRGLPCCFFVATDFIGTNIVPWWDEQLPVRCPWMTWEDVRRLDNAGFEVGSHTMSHADMGKVAGDEARRELRGSRERLERELNKPVHLFGYPYGRRNNMTEENRVAVREAGYSCCLSAFGGLVPPDADAFHIRRVPVSSWISSPYHLGFALLRQ